jgi:hypothetical protein
MLLGWAVILAWLDMNDNHQLLSNTRKSEIVLPNGSGVLSSWVGARPKPKVGSSTTKSITPVIIIAAEGGGIYAAYHTAFLLGAIQDIYPSFRHHIFAISGVSGGSVGATAFAQFCAWDDAGSNWSQSPNKRNVFRNACRIVFRNDYLEPVMAMALFPDLFQRFLPFPIKALDRARGLEQCYEYALSAADKNHRDPTPFYGLTSNFSQRSVPALFLNTTQVDSGERMVVANLATSTVYGEDPREPIGFKTLHHLAPNEDLPQSSAAFASARFPYITPVAYMLLTGPQGVQKHEFADGGYFENSALATTADLLHLFNLRLHAGDFPSVRLMVIHIGTADTVNSPDSSFNEALAPIRTLFNTRNARGANAVVQARRAVQDLQNIDGVPAEFVPFQLNVTSQRIPLGWVLSSSSCDAIESQVNDELSKSGEISTIGMLLRGETIK